MVASKYGEDWGDGPQSWGGEFMGVVCGEVFAWDGRILAKIVSFLLGLEIEYGFGKMGGMGINPFNWLFQGCMVLPLIMRFLSKPLC